MKKIKIGFVLCSNPSNPIPSTRISVLNMLPFLVAEGMQPCIIFAPTGATETPNIDGVAAKAINEVCSTVVFQKVSGPSVLACAQELAKHGIRTISTICDRVDIEMVSMTDETIVISEFLKSLYPRHLHSRIHVIHDGIENPEAFKKTWGTHNNPLRAILVTSHALDNINPIRITPPWLRVRLVGNYQEGLNKLREIHWNWLKKPQPDRLDYLKFLTNHRIKCVPWGVESVYIDMLNADIGIIPISTNSPAPNDNHPPLWMRKSENRLTLKMSMGLPVIATPIPSYESIIDHGRNGYFALTQNDWITCLKALRDPDRRREMGEAARATVISKYSKHEQAMKFIRYLR